MDSLCNRLKGVNIRSSKTCYTCNESIFRKHNYTENDFLDEFLNSVILVDKETNEKVYLCCSYHMAMLNIPHEKKYNFIFINDLRQVTSAEFVLQSYLDYMYEIVLEFSDGDDADALSLVQEIILYTHT